MRKNFRAVIVFENGIVVEKRFAKFGAAKRWIDNFDCYRWTDRALEEIQHLPTGTNPLLRWGFCAYDLA